MGKFPEASARIFKRVFICKNCKGKVKTDMQKILQKKVLCKKCGSKRFRPIKKGK